MDKNGVSYREEDSLRLCKDRRKIKGLRSSGVKCSKMEGDKLGILWSEVPR